MGKKSWRETIGINVPSEILSPGQNFLFWPIWCDVPRWHSWEFRMSPRHHRLTFELYSNGPESFPPGVFTHFGRPTAENYESVILTGVRLNGAFDRRATKTWVRSFWGATVGQIFEILACRDSDLYANCPECFPPGFFTQFGRPTAKNYESVYSTVMRPNGAFDRRATKTWFGSFDRRATISLSRYFWPMVRLMGGWILRFKVSCIHFTPLKYLSGGYKVLTYRLQTQKSNLSPGTYYRFWF